MQKREHRERGQIAGRKGFLEKKKDYKLRAADHKSKQRRLKSLREKARDRNEDEFSFKMMNTRTEKGVKIADRGNKALPMSVVKLLKTQDANYLRTTLQKVKRERQRLEQGMLIDEKTGELEVLKDQSEEGFGAHTVFVQDKQDQQVFDAQEWFGTDDDCLAARWNRQRVNEPVEEDDEDETPFAKKRASVRQAAQAQYEEFKEQSRMRKKRERYQRQLRDMIEGLREQERALTMAEQELDAQRERMSNSARSGVTKKGVKFQIRERKR